MAKGRKAPSSAAVREFIREGAEIGALRITKTAIRSGWLMIEVDASDRPDVIALIRAALRGIGEAWKTYRWLFASGDAGAAIIILDYHVEKPIQCDFQLVFDEERDAKTLRALADTEGRFMLSVPPIGGVGLYAPIDDLAPGLKQHKQTMLRIDPMDETPSA